MAVRTNDIALLELFEQSAQADATSQLRHVSLFLGRVPMIELHYEPLE